MSIRPWAVARRVQYGSGFLLFWLLVGAFAYYVNFYQAPTCLDGVMNGAETGVDCGGGCVQICAATVVPPRIVWAQSFEIAPGQYNSVAYIENTNQTAGVPELKYVLELKNNGTILASREGVIALPPNSVYPIFEGKIFTTGATAVTETTLTLKPASLWLPASVARDQFRSLDIDLTDADESPRLDVTIENTELVGASDVEVIATIFDEGGTPVTASKTYVESIPARGTKDIVFTWPNSIAKTVKSCIIPTDVAVAIDLSGSMNNDGGDPPQPVTAALEAASTFVSALKDTDQVALVTFATEATLISPLGASRDSVVGALMDLQIASSEESGFTNTSAALTLAASELNAVEHNNDARRVLVLLTDGLPNAAGDEDAVAEAVTTAAELNKDNIEVYAIGLGAGVDRQFINQIASEPANAYFAPTGADLADIYAEITSSLCESGPTKIDIIAKPKTNFAEVR